MKKLAAYIFTIAIILTMSVSCSENSNSTVVSKSSGNGQSQSSSMSNSNTNTFGSLQFYRYDTAYMGVSSNRNISDDRNLFFYGQFSSAEKDNSRLSEIFNEQVKRIDLSYQDALVYSSSDLDWNITNLTGQKKTFTLIVPCAVEKAINNFSVDKITLAFSNYNKTFSIGNYNVEFYKTAETPVLSCVEAPLTVPDSTMDLTLTYVVMLVKATGDQEYNFKLELPDSNNGWSISNVSWAYDEQSTQRLKKTYSAIKTENEIKNLKAYMIQAEMKLKHKSNILIKPAISAVIDGKREYCTSIPFNMNF